MANPLSSLAAYSQRIVEVLDRPTVIRSTVVAWSASPYTGVTEGEVFLLNGFRLRMREEIDFEAELLTSYGYEVYRGSEKLYWYDDFPHPRDPTLASTHPHHKHVPPDMKHHRIPAPGLTFVSPNLPLILQEIESLLVASPDIDLWNDAI